mmetsp:Transcript_5057/g.7310  ORF Transcript_5057/g.7310 Transcript_5057/m.7310 type:complete len:180 (+) Transcript_5057:723-1262(+)
MGGGTTDVTIIRKHDERETMSPSLSSSSNNESFQVLTTEGDGYLGRDDMDLVLAKHISNELHSNLNNANTNVKGIIDNKQQHAHIDSIPLRKCRALKETLRGNGIDISPSPQATLTHTFNNTSNINIKNHQDNQQYITITQRTRLSQLKSVLHITDNKRRCDIMMQLYLILTFLGSKYI